MRLFRSVVVLSLLVLFFGKIVLGQELKLVYGNNTEYNIVVSNQATDIESKAAEELQKYVKLISSVEIPIVLNSSIVKGSILVTNNLGALGEYVTDTDMGELGKDGFHIKTVGTNLILIGGSGKGVLYAVYSFLESYLNCRYYDRNVLIAPKRDDIVLGRIDNKEIPTITKRMVLYRQSMDELYRDWHKLDLYRDTKDSSWGNWAHSFFSFVPPAQYFKTHPEYFALNGGNRQATQLCLSNPEVLEIVTSELQKRIKNNPKAIYWSVSQEDNTKKCECDQCKSTDQKEESPSGSILNFVNKVAARFPNKKITTLAYSYSQKPPKTLKPANNVLIIFCTTGNFDRGRRYVNQQAARSYASNLKQWGAMTKELMIWDYVVDYKHFMLPVPNFQAMPFNLNDFVQSNANGIFWQGNIYGGGAFDELKSYLLAKLSWNPDQDPQKIMADFFNGYYGAAGPFISKYVEAMNQAYLSSGESLGIFDDPTDHIKGYLSVNNLNVYYSILNKAKEAVNDNATYIGRINALIANVDYAYLTNQFFDLPNIKDAILAQSWSELSLFSEDRFQKLTSISQAMAASRTSYINEGGLTPQQYTQRMRNVLDDPKALFVPDNLAIGKTIKLTYKPTDIHAKYAGNNALIDGIRGTLKLDLDTWQGFYGGKFEGVIDLGKVIGVKSVSTSFLQRPHVNLQYPTQFKVLYSVNGVSFKEFGNYTSKINEKTPSSETKDYFASKARVKCRYIKVIAIQEKKAPMFLDEIILK